MQNDAPKLAIGSTITEIPSSYSVKNLRNAHEEVMGSVAGIKLCDLLVNGLPVSAESFTFPEMEDRRGLHLAVRANGTSLRVIVSVLLHVTPVGLQLKSQKPWLEIIINLAETSVVERSIYNSTVFVHGPRCTDGAGEGMGSNILKMLPKVLVRTVVEVKLKEGRHLDDEVSRDRSTHAMNP